MRFFSQDDQLVEVGVINVREHMEKLGHDLPDMAGEARIEVVAYEITRWASYLA